MEIRQLRYFAEVAAAGSFTAAARNIGMAQPSLWRAVKTLEAELGFPLFVPSPRGVKLTRAGATMLARARHLLDVADALTELGHELKRGVDGLVVVGCAAPQVPTLIAPLIGDLHRSHPGIHVALRNTDAAPDVIELLTSDDELDFVTSPSKIERGVRRHLLARADVVVAMAADHPWARRDSVGLEELEGVPVILASPNTLSRQLVSQHLSGSGISLDVAFESDSLQTAIAMAEAGVGVAVIGDHGSHADGGKPKWPRLTYEGESISTPIWLYWLEDRPLQNPPAQRFIEVFRRARTTQAPY